MDQAIHQILQKSNKSPISVGSSHLVHVTHVNDPKSFYVRLASITDAEVVQLENKGEPISEAESTIGKHVVFKSNTLNRFVRGIVESAESKDNGKLYTIQAIDYGLKELVILNDIYHPKSVITEMCPPLALQCELHYCEPKGKKFDEEAISAMKFFVGTHKARIDIKFNTMNKLIVALKTVECPDDVGTMLSLLNFTTMTKVGNVVNRFSHHNLPIQKFKNKELTVGEQVFVRVQSGNSMNSFFVAEYNDYKQYVTDWTCNTQFGDKLSQADVYKAAEDGRSCIVRMRRGAMKYERAIVLKVTKQDAKALVKLVDWGIEEELPFTYIKNATEIFTINPAIAIHCSTNNKPWKTNLPKFLYPGFQFAIEILELGNGHDVPHKVNLIRTEPYL